MESGPEIKISEAEEKFERWRRNIGLFLGPIVFLAIYLSPFPGLTPEQHKLAAVIGFTMIYWICEPIPMPVTALLSPALCVLLGITKMVPMMADFANPVIFVFIGSFLLAEAMLVHALDKRIAMTILSLGWIGNSTRRVMFAFGAISTMLSMWLSNTATTAMLMPIALGILTVMAELIRKQTGKPVDLRSMRMSRGLMLITAYGASVGGIGTPIGTPPNLIGIAAIEKVGVKIGFGQWMIFAVPITIVMYFVMCGIMLLLQPPEVGELTGMNEYLHERRKQLGAWTKGQINSLIAFGAAIVLWVSPAILTVFLGQNHQAVKWYEAHVPEGVTALLAATLLFVLPVNWKERKFTLNWREASGIDWGTILLFGGGLSLGTLALGTGLAKVVGQEIFRATGVQSVGAITLLAIIIGVLVSESASHTASANMIVPVVIAVAQAANVNPVLPAIGATLGASYGFMFPVSTPPNAIVYGTGMIPMPTMVKSGALIGLCGVGAIWLGLRLFAHF